MVVGPVLVMRIEKVISAPTRTGFGVSSVFVTRTAGS